MHDVSRCVLGTVQLGVPYGVSNTTGQPDQAEAARIVSAAWAGGVREFDTAQGYGQSESVLGQALQDCEFLKSARVISKLPPVLEDFREAVLAAQVRSSLKRLKVSRLHGLMLHREEQLDVWDVGLGASMNGMKAKGYVGWCGVSVYSPEAALVALEMEGMDAIQCPANLFDRRFETAGVFRRAQVLGKTVYVRSVYLQGLLFMSPDAAERKVPGASVPLTAFDAVVQESGLSKAALCMGFVAQRYPQARILFGAETAEQVAGSIESCQVAIPAEIMERLEHIFVDDLNILDPSRWRNE